MIDRIKRLFSAFFNKEMDQLETPEILAEAAQNQLEDDLKKLRDAMANSLASEKNIEQQIRKNDEQLASWQQRAAVAVQQKNDDVARQCLVKKQEAEQLAQQLASQLSQQKDATVRLKANYQDTEQRYRDFQLKKADMISRAKAGDAAANIDNLLSNPGGNSMEKLEQKIRMKEAAGAASNQLAQEAKLESIAKQSDVDDELAALKQQMSSSSTPRLIEDKSSEENPPSS